MAKEKVVLAYSGGLDTSVIMKWLKENYDYDVIAVCCNAGQNEDFKAIEEKAMATGAIKAITLDIREEFITDYIWPTLKAGAKYENYLLGTAMARPLMAKRLVEIAQEEGAFYIAHGCTGKGNDQVRFESAIHSLDPAIKIIAPWRMPEWEFQSREEMIQYSHDHGIPISQSNAKIYSRDENIWHISHEGGELENPWNVHYDTIHVLSVPPEQAPDEVTYVDIDFEHGIPVAVDGVKMGPIELLTKLNELGSKNGIGTVDIIENRLVGMKSRGVYETPGGTILYKAHEVLETITLDKMTLHEKKKLAITYGELVYNGQWFTPLREALAAFFDKTQEKVTGKLKLKLYKGNVINAGVWSENSLYSEAIATFGESDYNQADAAGFINLFGLPIKVAAMLEGK